MSLNLDDVDAAILDAIAEDVGATRTDVIRWALRYYALAGPWASPGPEGRRVALDRANGDLTVGPRRKDVG